MAQPAAAPLSPEFRFHPDRVGFRLPWRLLPDASWTEDRAGVASGHAGLDALLALPGLAIVTLREDRLSVLREPGAAWSDLLPAIQGVLETYFVVPGAVFVPPANARSVAGEGAAST